MQSPMFALPARRDLLDNLRHLVHFSSRALLLTGPTSASCEHLLRALLVAEGAGLQRIDIAAGALPGGSSDSVLAAVHEKLSSGSRANVPGTHGDIGQSIQGLLRQLTMNAQLAGKRLLLTFSGIDRHGSDLCLQLLDLLYSDSELAAAFSIVFTSQTDFAKELAGPGGASKRVLQLTIKRLSFSEFSQYAELQLGRLTPSSRELQRHYQKLRGLPEAVDAFLLGSSQELLPTSEKPFRHPVAKAIDHSGSSLEDGSENRPESRPDAGKSSSSWLAALKRQRLLLLSVLIAGAGTTVLAIVYLADTSVSEMSSVQGDDATSEIEPVGINPESVPDENASAAREPSTQAEPVELAVDPINLTASAGEEQEVETASPASSTKIENPSELVDRMREQFLRQRAAGGFESDIDSAEILTTPKVLESPAATEPSLEPLTAASSDPSKEEVGSAGASSAAQVTLAPLLPDTIADPAPQTQTSSGEAGTVLPAPAEPVVSSSNAGSSQDEIAAPEENAAKSASVNTSERFRTADWVSARRSGDWTIQMLGSYSEDLVERFLNDNRQLGEAVYIQTTYKNKPWFIVLNGSYKSKTAAQAALRSLPASLKPAGFWIRPFNGLK